MGKRGKRDMGRDDFAEIESEGELVSECGSV